MLAARAPDICRAADVREQTPSELWRKVCHDVCVDDCEPWAGYPQKLLPTESALWSRLALRSDDDLKRRVRGLHQLMLACLEPSHPVHRLAIGLTF